MSKLIERGIFQKPNGIWWAWSFLKVGYCSSLRTRDKAKAKAKYDKLSREMRAGLLREMRAAEKRQP